MKQLFEEILRMPYYKNCAAESGKVHNVASHENAVESLLIKHGFGKSKIKGLPKYERDEWLLNPRSHNMKELTYISQPCGKNNSPDFIVCWNRQAWFLECKSVAKSTCCPMYNSGVPKPEYIYIFSGQAYDTTTIYRGKDICPPTLYEKFQTHIKQAREQDKILNESIGSMSTHGLCYYTRPMMQHAGKEKNYFENKNRHQYEQNVLALFEG